jgi:hypothetical protein
VEKENKKINRSDSFFLLLLGGGFELPTSIVSAAPHIFLNAAPWRQVEVLQINFRRHQAFAVFLIHSPKQMFSVYLSIIARKHRPVILLLFRLYF